MSEKKTDAQKALEGVEPGGKLKARFLLDSDPDRRRERQAERRGTRSSVDVDARARRTVELNAANMENRFTVWGLFPGVSNTDDE